MKSRGARGVVRPAGGVLDPFAADSDSGVIVGVLAESGCVRGDILRVAGMASIRQGGRDEVSVPTFEVATADDYNNTDETLFVLERGLGNGGGVGAAGVCVVARYFGLFGPITMAAPGVPPAGMPVYATDSGYWIGANPGTVARQVGSTAKALDLGGGNIRCWIFFDGSLAASRATLTFLDMMDLGGVPAASNADQARIIYSGGTIYVSIDTGGYKKLLPQFGEKTLVAGTGTVSGVTLTDASQIMIWRKTPMGTLGELSCPPAAFNVGAGTFVINSANVADISNVGYAIFN